MEGNATLDAHRFGGVAGTGDDPPFPTGNNRFPSQFGVNGLFSGGKEGIPIDMKNRPWPGMETEQDVAHGIRPY